MYRCPGCRSDNICIEIESKVTQNQRADGSMIKVSVDHEHVCEISCLACGIRWDGLSEEDWIDGQQPK